MFKHIPLIPTLIVVAILALGGPTLDYSRHAGFTWISWVTVAPAVLLTLYMVVAAVTGGIRDLKGPR